LLLLLLLLLLLFFFAALLAVTWTQSRRCGLSSWKTSVFSTIASGERFASGGGLPLVRALLLL